jgi:hypothetical protein
MVPFFCGQESSLDEPGVVVYNCNLSSQEVKAGESRAPGQGWGDMV